MKTVVKVVFGLAVVLCGAMLAVQAADDKEKTLKGTITCAKCDLKVPGQTKCHTVVKVKDTVYWFDPAGSKKYHKPICTEAKEGTVTGVVSEKDGKKWVKVSDVKFKE